MSTPLYAPPARPLPAWTLLLGAAGLFLLSGLLGLMPFFVEPAGAADPVNCGSTWFRASGLPAECYTTVDVWAVTAKGGMALAAGLAVGSLVTALVARSRRAPSASK
jgi:hypothetical protein